MKIVCIGGGPAGLYFGLLMKKLGAHHDIAVVERNRPYDTFGWGVVFSDATMDNMRAWTPRRPTRSRPRSRTGTISNCSSRAARSARRPRLRRHRRKTLLNILQARCEALGVKLVFETEADSDADYPMPIS